MAQYCFREPIAEIYQAASYLDIAACSHLNGDRSTAATYLKLADMEAVRAWTESLWGACSIYRKVAAASPPAGLTSVTKACRMPDRGTMSAVRERDGFHCRFCGIPVIRPEVRAALVKAYPESVQWGRKNGEQHAAFQAMWLQYDHLLPHARGGSNHQDNIVISCAPCNYCRMEYTLEEVGIADPMLRRPVVSSWDGLERVLRG